MDRSQIISIVINAVLTIVTTAVVTRLSLNQGKLGVTDTLKARFTPMFKAYMKVILSAGVLLFIAWGMYRDISKTDPPTRFDMFKIAFGTQAAFLWLFITLIFISQLQRLKRTQSQSDNTAAK